MIATEWAKVKQPEPAWYWICDATHFGDLYQVCAFAAAFRDHHGWHFPLNIIATSQTQADVAELFGPCFDKVIVAPGLQGSAEQWRQFHVENGLPHFGLDTPIMIYTPYSPAVAGFWDFTVDQNKMTVIPLIKRMLQLPVQVEPRPPPLVTDLQAQAQVLCEKAGITQGRSVILCPYARSEKADATAAFALLARALERAGYSIFTSIAGDERAIEGTAPVRIPFSLLPEVAGYAGWVVALRSGVADVISNVVCRKSIIYQSFDTLRNWSLAVLGLCPDAQELVFRFEADAPERFVDTVIRGAPAGRRLSRFAISETLRPDRSICFSDLDKVKLEKFLSVLKFRLYRRNRQKLRITDIPPCCHDRVRNSRQGLIDALARLAGKGRWQLLACRDGSGNDFFEPIDSSSLLGGHYYWATYWHTLMIIGWSGFTADTLSEATLPNHPIGYGTDIRPADALGSRGHIDRLTGHLPLCYGGLQFLDGWSDLEYWGIWSLTCLSTLKILLPAAPLGALAVQLDVTVAALSIRMPSIAFTVTANEVEVGSFELSGQAEPHKLEVLMPRHVVKGQRSLMLRFRFPHTLSPLQQGNGSLDARPIALGLHRLRVDLHLG